MRERGVNAHALDRPPWRPQLGGVILQCPSCGTSNRVPAARLGDKARCAHCKSSLLPLTAPLTVKSAEDFDELVRGSPVPVLVDFWAAWCGPCQMVAPELQKLAASRSGSVAVAKVDTDALPDVAGRYGIRSIPTMILFKGGAEAKRIMGARPASAIESELAI